MAWVFGTIAATLGVLLLWGLVAPRGQWRILRAWSVADPHRDEPGGAVFGWLRLSAGIGVVGLAVVGIVGATSVVSNMPKPPPPRTPLQLMWGSPAPHLLDRVSLNLGAPPEGLVEIPALGYQDFDDGIPSYLLELRGYTLLGDPEPLGLEGAEPEEGTSALGASNLLVHVRGPILCIPREIVVIETETTVQIGVYYGAPDDPAGAPVDHAASCRVDDPLTGSLLIPVQLTGPVGDREVQNLAAEPIDYVHAPG
ncbi:hypothetical protein PYV02_10290 [Leifsonia sp. H3M29-4]|uniref:hypothetical protein n=1 Tax=Salinibacterium metalliresistens TaxID=3031321 RepID=UPI0023DB08DE|nr:hypothetical protein [Salinibacterium metalliresistens]MDF1479470.1 hypothetical protein [Salinibacterium metalliresistens]